MRKPALLIVGAGPVGLTLAIECRRQNIPFRIVDRNETHSKQSKALALWSGTLECLAAMGVIDDFLKVGLPIEHLVFADHGKILNNILSNKEIDSPYPCPIVLPQSQTEKILERYLEKQGIKVERNVTLRSFSQDEHEVTVELVHPDRSLETLQTTYLAGCDGARSLIRHRLPVNFEGETEPLGFVLIDAKIEGEIASNAMFVNWSNDYTTAFFPVKSGVFRMFTQRKDPNDQSIPTLEEMQNYLHLTGLDRLRFYDPEWLSYFSINERVASRNRVGRVFLLGDASHIHSPAGGQGMNTGMQDAMNLGWKFGLIYHDKGNPETIAESYFQERHPVAKTLVKETTNLLHAGITNTSFVRLIKDFTTGVLLQTPVLQRILSEKLSEMNIHYSKSDLIEYDYLSADKRLCQAGWRVFDAEVTGIINQETTSLWSHFLHPHHTLLVFTGNNNTEEIDVLLLKIFTNKYLYETHTRKIIVSKDYSLFSVKDAMRFVDTTGLAHERFGISEPSWLLIRPDLYVAARATLQESERLQRYLKKITPSYS